VKVDKDTTTGSQIESLTGARNREVHRRAVYEPPGEA
jgi:hypothetical protein